MKKLLLIPSLLFFLIGNSIAQNERQEIPMYKKHLAASLSCAAGATILLTTGYLISNHTVSTVGVSESLKRGEFDKKPEAYQLGVMGTVCAAVAILEGVNAQIEFKKDRRLKASVTGNGVGLFLTLK